MPEYICKADIEQRAIRMYGFGENKYVPLSAIEHIPAADVASVVHGRWIETSEGTFCSECNKNPIPVEHYNVCNFTGAYCPNCGAKMDGEGGNHERET